MFRVEIFITLHNAYIDLILAGMKHEVNRCLAVMSSRFLRNVLYISQNQHEACTVFFDDVKERTVSLYLEALNTGKNTLKFFIHVKQQDLLNSFKDAVVQCQEKRGITWMLFWQFWT